MSTRDEALVEAARAVLENAHAPYSGLRVGAALLTADGRIFNGCNVENASFGLTLCAERTAVCKAVSEGERDLAAIAIVSSAKQVLMPCGACRQVLMEFAPNLRVILQGEGTERTEVTLTELLPHSFRPSDLADHDSGANEQ